MGKRSLGIALVVLVAVAASPGQAQAQETECRPDCRAGFVCVDGSCVSKCNPPCAEGQACTDAGTCVAEESPPVAAATTTPAAVTLEPQDAAQRALADERSLLLRQTHRLGGPIFLTVLGGGLTAAGIAGLSWGLTWCPADAGDPDDYGQCQKLAPWIGGLVVGGTLLAIGIWRIRLKLRRREAQRERLDEIERQLLSLEVGPSRVALRFVF